MIHRGKMENSPPRIFGENLSRDVKTILTILLFSMSYHYCVHVLNFGLVDDAFIPMIYARNFWDGNGLVFYPGGERVEGFSSPLWLTLLGGFEPLRFDLSETALILGLMFGVAILIFATLLYTESFFPEGDSIHDLWQFILMTLIISDASFMAWSFSGMETTLYSWLLILLILSIFAAHSSKPTIITITLITATRPEGLLIAFLGITVLYLKYSGILHYGNEKRIVSKNASLDSPNEEQSTLAHKPNNIKQLSSILLKYFLIPVGLLFLLRWLYFGYPLPNTFYAKHDFAGWEVWVRGFHYVLTFFIPRPLFLFAILWVLLEKPQLRTNGLVIWAVILTHTAAVIWEGGDHFALHRFMMPVIPLLAVLSLRGIELFIHQFILRRLKEGSFFDRTGVHIGTVILMLIVIYFHGRQLFEYKANDRYHFSNGTQWFRDEVNWARNWVQVGKWLKEKYPPGTKIAVVTAGAIPYYSELPAIDIMGLNDVTIAHTPAQEESRTFVGHEKSNPDYVLAQEPQWVQLFPLLFFGSQPFPEENLEQLLTYPAQKDLWRHPEFQEKYKYTSQETPYGFISYFERRNLDDGL